MRLKKAFEVRGNLELEQNNRIVSNFPANTFSAQAFTVTSFMKCSTFMNHRNRGGLQEESESAFLSHSDILQARSFYHAARLLPAAAFTATSYSPTHRLWSRSFFLWSWFIICIQSNGLTIFYRICVAPHEWIFFRRPGFRLRSRR